jgi:hypothetical protein
MDYSNYFKELEKYEKNKEEEKKKNCCNNQIIIVDISNNLEICESCGNTKKYVEYVEENALTQINPYYRLTSVISSQGGYKFKALRRLHKWNNFSYKENTAISSYKEIRKIGLEIKLINEIINNSIQLYKDFYINNEISTRHKIKKSLYIYCLFYNSFELNFFDIFEVLSNYELSIDNFNKSIQRSNYNKYFLQNNMKLYIDIINKNYNIKLKLKSIIIIYNDYLIKNSKFNSNSILILILYDLLLKKNIKINQNNFYKLFSISNSTIKKIKNLKKN